MPVTLRELARAASVSVTTASRALNNSDHAVSSEARERVLRAAVELGYRPNVSARTLRMDRSFTVGIMASDITSYFTPIIIRGVQDVLKVAGYFCVIASFNNDTTLQHEALDALVSRGVDGVIFVESWQYSGVPQLQQAGKPYVFSERLFSTRIANSVVSDNRYGAILAIRHLLEAGHRRIGLINGPPDFYITGERLQGYQEALAEAGVPFAPELVVNGTWMLESGIVAMRKLLQLDERPTAIFANDMMAVGAIQVIQANGLRVPDDIAVVGYDDHPIATQLRPQLTTVTLPCYEMGQEAATLLLRQIEEDHGPTEERVLKGKLIVRESCGTRRSS